MYACVTNEFECAAIDDMLFASVTNVLDRYLPYREKHGALRGSMTVLAVNTLPGAPRPRAAPPHSRSGWACPTTALCR